MKKIVLGVTLIITGFLLIGCKNNKITIAIPNDLTNEARALLLLNQLQIIEIDQNNDLNIGKKDILNSNNIKIVELAADQIATRLDDFDYAVINGNYALNAKITDKKIENCQENIDSVFAEKFGNLIAVKEGNEKNNKTIAVLNALKQSNIKEFIEKKYLGSVSYLEFDVEKIIGGNNEVIKIGASSVPHAEILKETIPYLKEYGYELDIIIFNDYVLPNLSLQDESLDLNYFQHEPYLNEFNLNNKTNLKNVGKIHFEPLAIYSSKYNDLSPINLL